MENRSYAIIALGFLGLFVALIVATIVWLRRGPPENRYYDIVSPYSVGGLQVQAAVKFKGLTVGHVRSMDFDPQNPSQVLVRIAVHPDTYITTATHAELGYQGLTGLAHISLVLDDHKRGKPLETNASQPARIPMQQSLIQYVTRAGKSDAKRIGEILVDLQGLLAEKNLRNISQLLDRLDEASRRVLTLEQQLSPTVKALPKLAQRGGQAAESLRDFGTSAQQLMRELSSTRAELDAAIERFQKTARDVDRLSKELRRKPSSVLFGAPPPSPGPGEPGFHPPPASEKR